MFAIINYANMKSLFLSGAPDSFWISFGIIFIILLIGIILGVRSLKNSK